MGPIQGPITLTLKACELYQEIAQLCTTAPLYVNSNLKFPLSSSSEDLEAKYLKGYATILGLNTVKIVALGL